MVNTAHMHTNTRTPRVYTHARTQGATMFKCYCYSYNTDANCTCRTHGAEIAALRNIGAWGTKRTASAYTHAQALRMYRAHGVRVSVPLAPQARTVRARTIRNMRASVAGLTELAVPMQMQRGMFETNADFGMRVLHAQSAAHTAQVAREMQVA